jgi:mono/diheme cytochrome c family protein
MAPHDFLKDQEVADVLTYIRNSFGNKASLLTAAEVKAQRTAVSK